MYTITTTCITCGLDASPVGDDGFLGTPSLSTEIDEDTDPEEMPFGYLYEPLQGIGLRPRDLEAMQDFLKTHEKHRVVAWSDTQSEKDWPKDLAALLAKRDSRGPVEASDEDDGVVFVGDQADAAWAVGEYAVHCLDCGTEHAFDEPATLRRFERLPLGRKAVDMMLSRWGDLAPDDGWNHALRPIVDPYEPFMEGLLEFLEAHQEHRLEARLKPL